MEYLYKERFNPIWQRRARAAAPASTPRYISNVAAKHREVAQAAMFNMLQTGVPLADIASFCKLAEQAACDCESRAVENRRSPSVDFYAAWPGAPEPQATTVSRANVHSSALYGEWPGAGS